MSNTTRRRFLKSTSLFVAASSLPSLARAQTRLPTEKFNTAHVGVGGMGSSDLGQIAGHKKVNVAALCDVDSNALAKALKRFPDAKTFSDYREMLATMGDKIDGVVVSTPDHTHAPAAMTAMNLDKPVYCQKPLTHEIGESRQLRLVAAEKKLVTQMGVQIHSSAVYRRAVRMIQNGAIGKVSEVHAWSNKNWGYDGKQFEKNRECS